METVLIADCNQQPRLYLTARSAHEVEAWVAVCLTASAWYAAGSLRDNSPFQASMGSSAFGLSKSCRMLLSAWDMLSAGLQEPWRMSRQITPSLFTLLPH